MTPSNEANETRSAAHDYDLLDRLFAAARSRSDRRLVDRKLAGVLPWPDRSFLSDWDRGASDEETRYLKTGEIVRHVDIADIKSRLSSTKTNRGRGAAIITNRRLLLLPGSDWYNRDAIELSIIDAVKRSRRQVEVVTFRGAGSLRLSHFSGDPASFAATLEAASEEDARLHAGLEKAFAAAPSDRLLRGPREAEEAAAAWLRWMGFFDAEETSAGPDAGIDVEGTNVVAQIKARMAPTGRPDVQRLVGVATHARKRAIFFSLAGYTAEARQFADETGVALFRFDTLGRPEAANSQADGLLRDRGRGAES